MKYLWVSNDNNFSDLAYRCMLEGNQCLYYTKWKEEKDIAQGIVPLTDNWESKIGWADVIIFEDTGYGHKADQLRKKGKKVFGGSSFTDRIEKDRTFGMETAESVGIKVPFHQIFKNIDECMQFIKQNPSRYVIKPNSDDNKNLSFVGKQPDGHDVVDFLDYFKRMKKDGVKVSVKKHVDFTLQKAIDGVEMGVTATFDGTKMSVTKNCNFEHKKLFPGNYGENTGEVGTVLFNTHEHQKTFTSTLDRIAPLILKSGYRGVIDIETIVNDEGVWFLEFTCFDEKTEVLTKQGWKNYNLVFIGDEVMSINPETKEIGWKKVTNKFSTSYSGNMIRIGGESKRDIDVLVTPEHKLLSMKKDKIRFQRADKFESHTHIPRCGEWIGKHDKFITIPKYIEKHYLGKYKKYINIVHPEIKMDSKYFMAFLGLYLSEGSANNYIITISQSVKSKKRKDIESILDKTGFKYSIQKNGGYQINSIQLITYLKMIGLHSVTSHEKFIPNIFKEYDKSTLEGFLWGFCLGDGCVHKRTKQVSWFTSSKRLADDIQEIVIKCGDTCNIHTTKTKGTKMSVNGGKEYTRNSDMYFLGRRKERKDYFVDKRNKKIEKYEGMVWDIEVEDWHTMLVRRNGKPYFSGNCRFGHPQILITDELLEMEWSAYIHDTAAGNLQDWESNDKFACGVVLFAEGFPHEESYPLRGKDQRITGITGDVLQHLHFGEMKREGNDFFTAGCVGFIAVATGSADTIAESRAMAMSYADKVDFPNKGINDSIGVNSKRDLARLIQMGQINPRAVY